MGALWVAKVLISARTEEKINSKHGITADQVRDAEACIDGLECVHDNDEVRGWRWLVKTSVQGRRALIVLYDADDPMGDVYRLGSAYFTVGQAAHRQEGIMSSMSSMSQDDDFYEEDENVDDLLAAFDSAEERGTTQRPASGQTHWLNLLGMASRSNVQQSGNTANLFAA